MSLRTRRPHTPRVALLALVLAAGAARGDGAWLRERRDERGRVVAVVPRQSTTIGMRRETVALVPFLAGSDVLLYVNVRYVFANQGAPAELLVGFPELRGRIVERECGYECPDVRTTTHAVIETFSADVGGRALAVQTQPGSGDYARWFAFSVPFAAGDTTLRNLYVAHAGSTTSASNINHDLQYRAEYVLHTGSQWAGAIGEGDVHIWNGGRQLLRHFENLRPTARDDVQAPIDAAAFPSAGRPMFLWDYGNGRQGESTTPRLEGASLVQHSSALAGDGLAHLGAMALDGDPNTAWIDAGAQGGRGEWLQVPTFRMARLRGLRVQFGAPPAGAARIRELELTCFDLEGNARVATELERQTVLLADQDAEQRVVLPRPMGACHAVRLRIGALYGPAGAHGSLAELAFIE